LEIEESETYVEEYYEDSTFREGFDNTQQQSMAETFKRSWAAWRVAEDALKEDPSVFGAQSFGLIALGRMLEILKASGLM
jgi:RNA-dependent RNA polymerase